MSSTQSDLPESEPDVWEFETSVSEWLRSAATWWYISDALTSEVVPDMLLKEEFVEITYNSIVVKD
ncbi:5630_t:CDS:2 [Paraglomus occultum]|uniref:5630_t:CDS:1 n=1 Tax=Paraglomus occultum TaxID=144539 RepID=A0A9N8VM57_9GLOM|nr:5630_t:CDS:2 [Paraglomus occultum]